MYRLLVSRPQTRLWKQTNVSAVGYHRDLYTRLTLGAESDEFENWLNREFESPAEQVLSNVAEDNEINASDWETLVRFLACQSVRTPAFFLKMLPVWNRITPIVLNDTVKEVKAELLWAKVTGESPSTTEEPRLKNFPMRVDREDVPEQKSVRFSTQIVVGRGLWLSTMELLLTHSIRHLERHHWSIFHAAPGASFFTSDDPVVKLNYRGPSNYDFSGGWGSQGTEFLFPLSPRHLMYTKIGARFPPRGVLLTDSETSGFREMIARHAHRYIFAASPDSEAPRLRPRAINAARVALERAQWESWHADQTEAESKLI
jgi:Protein of unknown function (DUF4238)